MRYSEIDLQCEDILWFGVDQNGCVFGCTSGGLGPVPEFVCKNKENAEYLIDFFMEKLAVSTHGELLIQNNGSPLAEDGLLLSSKGVFCFDVSLDDNNLYRKIAAPINPLQVETLPENIKTILADNLVDVDVCLSEFLSIEHAY